MPYGIAKMEKINVVNYHVTMLCNYRCRFCYAKCKVSALSQLEQFQVCNAIKEFFDEQMVADGRINFAGGEPLLHKGIYELLYYCKSTGIKTSIITNASLLTEEVIKRLADCGIETIGISVDSLSENTNRELGRCTISGKTLSCEDLVAACKLIKFNGMKVKINSCVTLYNHSESIAPLLSSIEYDRFKILKAHKIAWVNDSERLYVDTLQFKEFCDRHIQFAPVIEDDSDMENSYVIIYPDGNLLDNQGGQYRNVGSCLNINILEMLDGIAFNLNSFCRRYRKDRLDHSVQ